MWLELRYIAHGCDLSEQRENVMTERHLAISGYAALAAVLICAVCLTALLVDQLAVRVI
jgi:hypothetical protein